MSDTVKLAQQSVQGQVEQVNPRGLKVRGTWYDYAPEFGGEPLDGACVGQEVELALVESTKKRGKFLVRELEVCGTILGEEAEVSEAEVAPAVEAGSADAASGDSSVQAPASTKSLDYIRILAGEASLGDEDVERILEVRFKKSIGALTQSEASQTIVFLGGYMPGRGRSNRK